MWSAVRKSDLKNFVRVINSSTKLFFFRAEKTGEVCEIPAFDTLKRLGAIYNYDFPRPYCDTIVFEEIMNIYKLIPSMNITVEKKFTRGVKKVREFKKKY